MVGFVQLVPHGLELTEAGVFLNFEFVLLILYFLDFVGGGFRVAI